MIDTIKFKNYKLFKDWQTLEIKPITVLIGKNSSGKSAILKLLPMIENSLSGTFSEPLHLNNNGVEMGGEFRDLVYGRNRVGRLDLIMSNDQVELSISIGSDIRSGNIEILDCKINQEQLNIGNTVFNGFIPLGNDVAAKLGHLTTNYITSSRSGLQRYFDQRVNNYKTVGIEGENVYAILIEDALTTEQKLIKDLNDFYENNFEGWRLSIAESSPPFQIEFVNQDLKVNIKDVGVGMVYMLPLVVATLMNISDGTLVLMEEPELHLHPAAHGNLAELFAINSSVNKRYLIETHSPNFILRLRRLIAEKKIECNSIAIYYVDFDEKNRESILKKIDVDDSGRVSSWPDNIFSETLEETIAIRTAQLIK